VTVRKKTPVHTRTQETISAPSTPVGE